jgi:hypothetical protein
MPARSSNRQASSTGLLDRIFSRNHIRGCYLMVQHMLLSI